MARALCWIVPSISLLFALSFSPRSSSAAPLGSALPLRSPHGPQRSTWASPAFQQHAAPLRLRGGALSFLAAYMLLKIGGNESPSKDDIKKLLNSVGASIDEDLIEKVVTELNGKDVNELIEKGKLKMMEDSKLIDAYDALKAGGGNVGGSPAAAAPGAGAKDGDKGKGGGDKGGGKEDKKKEEKKEEKKESEGSDLDMGFGLFD